MITPFAGYLGQPPNLFNTGHQSEAFDLVLGYLAKNIGPRHNPLNNPNTAIGIIAYSARSGFVALLAHSELAENGLEEAYKSGRLAAAEALLADTAELFDKAVNEKTRVFGEIDDARHSAERLYRKKYLSVARRIRNERAEVDKQFAARQAKFDNLETTYNAHLRIQRPVRLWAAREKIHWKKSNIAWHTFVVAVLVFGVVVIGFVAFGADWVADAFISTNCGDNPDTPCGRISPKGPIVVSAIFLLSTIVVWFLRLQIKIYLSERHLALDAAERRAFAETYLSLLKGGDVSTDHEVIVLESLFRPTQDGIINDDGVSDIGIHGLASRILEGRKS